MNIVICGTGEIGSHAAESLAAAGHSITVIDIVQQRLTAVEETMDVRTLLGNCAEASVLKRADVATADLVLAATDKDEINLLTASIAKGLGATRCVARVHRTSYFEQPDFDYKSHFNIDRLICPEYATSLSIARKLRNPGALAVETFARGKIDMQQFVATSTGSAVGQRLMDISFPDGTRLAMISRKGESIIPEAESVVVPGDTVIMVGNRGVFAEARRFFHTEKQPRKNIVLMGGPPMAVWLCAALRDRNHAIRLFETDRQRAEELAELLEGVTVIHANPTDRATFQEERLGQADAFISLLDSDEENIVSGVFAKTRGVLQVYTVLQKSRYLDLVFDIGVDHVFSPHQSAMEEIDAYLDEGPLRLLSSLAEGEVDVFRVRIGDRSPVIDKSLKEIKLSPDWVIAAIQRNHRAWVPGANDIIEANDVVLVVGKHGKDRTLKKFFAIK